MVGRLRSSAWLCTETFYVFAGFASLLENVYLSTLSCPTAVLLLGLEVLLLACQYTSKLNKSGTQLGND